MEDGIECIMKKTIHIISLGLACVAVAGCASKSDIYMVQDDVRQLQEQSQQSGGESAEMYAEMQRLRDEVASLQGTIEEMRYQMKQQDEAARQRLMQGETAATDSTRLETLYMPDQATTGLQPASAEQLQPPVVSPGTDAVQNVAEPEAALPKLSDQSRFTSGRAAFERYDYPAARKELEILLADYPQSPLADDAQYYIAETYFNEKWFEKAILEYQLVIEKYPEGNQRPAAYFKQGLAFEEIGDSTNARVRFRELVQLYPESNEASVAAERLP